MSPTTTKLTLDEIFNLAKTALTNNGANEENADAVATLSLIHISEPTRPY